MVPRNVTLQAHVVIEALVTMLALVGLLPGVQAHVGCEVARLVEGTKTELAHKWLHTSVHHHVSLYTVGSREDQRTKGA